MKEFTKWLTTNGVNLDGVRFGYNLNEGNGVIATKDFNVCDNTI